MKIPAKEYYDNKKNQYPDALDRLVPLCTIDPEKIKTIHLVGICGKAMASLAGLLHAAGYVVSGSDNAWNPPMSTVLEHIGIRGSAFSEKNCEGKDLIIVGNAASSSHVEAVTARQLGVLQMSASDAYAQFFIQDKKSIVVAGTHGKTTTSSMMTHVFLGAHKKVTALVGGIVRNIGESYCYGGSDAEYSIVEGDEYDTAYFDKSPKFLHYRPTTGIITSVEFDHADIYKDIDDYVAAFVFFAAEIPERGILFVHDNILPLYREKIVSACAGTVYSYGQKYTSDCYIEHARPDTTKKGQYIDIVCFGVSYKDIFIPLMGVYNAENALAVIATALQEGIDEATVRTSIASFQGAEQRQQVLCDMHDIVVMSDFAHHPTAVLVTLQGVRDTYPDRRIVAVFEPRSNTSRRKDFEVPYMHAFGAADSIVIAAPIVRWNDNTDAMMSIDTVVQGIVDCAVRPGVTAVACDTSDKIVDVVAQQIQQGDVIVCMSNGFFDGVPQRIAECVQFQYK